MLRRLAPITLAAVLALPACTDRGVDPVLPAGEPSRAFATARTCGTCHPQHLAEWEASMHAFAGSDPVMLALSELAAREGGDAIGQECIACHSPALTRLEQLTDLPPGVSAADFAEDGVNCDVCHSVQVVPPVASIDYLENVDPSGPKLGGLRDPVPNDAHESLFDNSYQTSINCAPCHQVNLEDGTGIENTYDEWLGSFHAGFGNECQDCHMPAYTGRAAEGGPIRPDVHRHRFVGVDYATVDFRGIDREAQKDEIRALLQNSVTTTLARVPASVVAGGSLDFSVSVANDVKTGHSIPSGTSFSREMWIEVYVRDGTGAAVDSSGWQLPDGDLVTPAADPALSFFGSKMYEDGGARTFFTWRAASIDESQLLAVGQTRVTDYSFTVPAQTTGPLDVSVRLLFRPMNPKIIRAAALDHLLPIEIFEMWSDAFSVTLQ